MPAQIGWRVRRSGMGRSDERQGGRHDERRARARRPTRRSTCRVQPQQRDHGRRRRSREAGTRAPRRPVAVADGAGRQQQAKDHHHGSCRRSRSVGSGWQRSRARCRPGPWWGATSDAITSDSARRGHDECPAGLFPTGAGHRVVRWSSGRGIEHCGRLLPVSASFETNGLVCVGQGWHERTRSRRAPGLAAPKIGDHTAAIGRPERSDRGCGAPPGPTSPGPLYRHFPSGNDLLAAAFKEPHPARPMPRTQFLYGTG